MLPSCSLLFALALSHAPALPSPADGPVKVFILAGQSNMEGKVQNPLLEHQGTDPATAEMFAHLRDEQGWVERDDVFIKFLGRHGGLTLGYGSPGRTGVELELGTVLGDHFEEPVLLIKTAWGGHSLYKLFRSPSAGLPSEETLQAELDKAVQRVERQNAENERDDPLPTMEDIVEPYGSSYRNMMAEIAETYASYETLFPALAGRELELAGFFWHQGWNDQYNGAEQEYESNMRHFIHDVRADLEAPDLPFVIGVMGQNGSEAASGPMLAIQPAQLAMAELEEFSGKVAAVRTDELVDTAAEELYPTWRDNFEQWQLIGSDHKYHYLGSAIWHLRMGRECAGALLAML